MKFLYQYRTADNIPHSGVINAASKDAAYAALRSRGIRPGRVDEAPGFFNKLFGKGKRWLAIAILTVTTILSVILALKRPPAGDRLLFECADRAQLYGDPVVISKCESAGWTNVFSSAFECFLASYAIPGDIEHSREANGLVPTADDFAPTPIDEKDLAEIQLMKRMVNGLKRECAEYMSDGGSFESYVRRLVIRQKAEHSFLENAMFQIKRTKDRDAWQAKNAELRAMGLPMYEPSDEDDLSLR